MSQPPSILSGDFSRRVVLFWFVALSLLLGGCVVVTESSEPSPTPTPPSSAPVARPVAIRPASAAAAAARAPEPVEVPAGPAGDHVVFFSEPNFRGDSFIVETGAAVDDLRALPLGRGSWNRVISSFRIQGIATVIAYAEGGRRGTRFEISSSVADLVAERRGTGPEINWDNAISSLQVLAPRARASEPAPSFDRRTADNIVQRAYRDFLGREPDASGLRSYREKLVDQGWSEEDVRNHIRRSSEFRAINPDDVIRKAYREVLRREPDAEGLRHYRDLLVNQGWTIPQLRADLLRSDEWTDQRIRAAIEKAYRDLLGRAPDPDGFANYERAIRQKGWSEKQVRDDIARSPEARARQAK